jgi:hypothetical protein
MVTPICDASTCSDFEILCIQVGPNMIEQRAVFVRLDTHQLPETCASTFVTLEWGGCGAANRC